MNPRTERTGEIMCKVALGQPLTGPELAEAVRCYARGVEQLSRLADGRQRDRLWLAANEMNELAGEIERLRP